MVNSRPHDELSAKIRGNNKKYLVLARALKTGLYYKMPLHAGQYFADAFADAFLNDKIEKPVQTL